MYKYKIWNRLKSIGIVLLQIFGCDGHMDSGKSFDQCGVCDGAGNTCTKVSGTFKAGKARGILSFIESD